MRQQCQPDSSGTENVRVKQNFIRAEEIPEALDWTSLGRPL